MNRFKKIIWSGIAAVAIGGFAMFNVSLNSQNKLPVIFKANLEALSIEGNSGTCKWKMIDCPGWGNGDYEACLVNGDGNSCSCGTVTRDCPK
ncbi:MAG: hypothetical protein LBG80_05285 [Bacteroidales bacterium]|jgi:hypothetical protein|nr:hypothetical protein [Bacteroidales bacterium]